ncbi:hypothetical protein IWQ60_004431 [Tieghemiomyces parasiticus]|uniref:Peptidase S1 domain-containing protein n=1 Tax=Tieghemiomyces parasiticus TaxID=78921 RepID=A0A9W8ADP4_9FUNG|nr:hypothetical protein IWQ60_004431 [Tieghemiomyces parasiticus]
MCAHYHLPTAIATLVGTKDGLNVHKLMRITGGTEAPTQAFPFMAHARIIDSPNHGSSSSNVSWSTGNFTVECGAVFLSAEWVATAGHCAVTAVTSQGNRPRDPSQFTIGYGSVSKSAMQTISVSEVILHPEYDRKTPDDHDIALLRLSHPVPLAVDGASGGDGDVGETVRPIRIYTSTIVEDQPATVMGWGLTNPANLTTFPDKLVETTVSLSNDQQMCSLLDPGFINSNNDKICSTRSQGRDTCQGDSGGPLVVTYPASDSHGGGGGVADTQWALAGLTSYGNSLSGEALCGASDNVAYYTHVAYYLPFIIAKTGLRWSDLVVGDGTTNTVGNSDIWYRLYHHRNAGSRDARPAPWTLAVGISIILLGPLQLLGLVLQIR